LALFHFIGPEERALPDYTVALVDLHPTLVILDGVNEGMGLHGMPINDPEGATAWRNRLVKPFTTAGAAVLSADHVVKDADRRTRYSFGSGHKGNALNGAMFELVNTEPFGRGRRGRSRLTVNKDRPGHLRRRGLPAPGGKFYVGDLVVDDRRTFTPILEAVLYAPKAGDEHHNEDDTEDGPSLVDQVVEVIAALPGGEVTSQRKAGDAYRTRVGKIRDAELRDALGEAVRQERMATFDGPRNATGYRVVG